MTTRTRQGTPRRKASPANAKTQAHLAERKHATTPDPLRQQQALSNQGTQGRGGDWGMRAEDEDEDEVPPTLH